MPLWIHRRRADYAGLPPSRASPRAPHEEESPNAHGQHRRRRDLLRGARRRTRRGVRPWTRRKCGELVAAGAPVRAGPPGDRLRPPGLRPLPLRARRLRPRAVQRRPAGDPGRGGHPARSHRVPVDGRVDRSSYRRTSPCTGARPGAQQHRSGHRHTGRRRGDGALQAPVPRAGRGSRRRGGGFPGPGAGAGLPVRAHRRAQHGPAREPLRQRRRYLPR